MEYTKEILRKRLTAYKQYTLSSQLNSFIRKPNFPEDISENIVRLYELQDCSEWKHKSGDLYSKSDGKIEVKCFSSTGPISFGPKETWDLLYIVDATLFYDDKFSIYKINLSNKDDIWRNIRVSLAQSYEDQILQKRRPRITWKKLYAQIYSHCEERTLCI